MKDFKKSIILSIEEFEQIKEEISELKKLIGSDTTITVESERNRIINLYANRYMAMMNISEMNISDSKYNFNSSDENKEIYKAMKILKKYDYFDFSSKAD